MMRIQDDADSITTWIPVHHSVDMFSHQFAIEIRIDNGPDDLPLYTSMVA